MYSSYTIVMLIMNIDKKNPSPRARTREGRSLTTPGSPRLESHPSARPESRPQAFLVPGWLDDCRIKNTI